MKFLINFLKKWISAGFAAFVFFTALRLIYPESAKESWTVHTILSFALGPIAVIPFWWLLKAIFNSKDFVSEPLKDAEQSVEKKKGEK